MQMEQTSKNNKMIKIINPKNIKNLAPMTPANLKLGDISTPHKLQKSNSRNIN
jgi:hypothetical protein